MERSSFSSTAAVLQGTQGHSTPTQKCERVRALAFIFGWFVDPNDLLGSRDFCSRYDVTHPRDVWFNPLTRPLMLGIVAVQIVIFGAIVYWVLWGRTL